MLKMIENQMETPPDTTGSLSGNLKKAQNVIQEIKRDAAQQ